MDKNFILTQIKSLNERATLLHNDNPREALDLAREALVHLNSLNGLGSKPEARKERITALLTNGICAARLGSYHDGLPIISEALVIAEELGDRHLLAKTHICKAYLYRFLAESALSREHYQKALEYSSEIDDKQLSARALTGLGLLCYIANDYRCALEKYSAALEVQEIIGDKVGQGWSLLNLAAVYRSTDKFHKAAELFFRSLDIWKELEDRRGQAITLQNIGLTLLENGETDTALGYLRQGSALFGDVGDISSLANTLKDIAGVLRQQGDYIGSEEYFLRSLKLHEGISARFSEAGTLIAYGEFLVERARYPDAMKIIMKAANIFRNVDSRSDRSTILASLGKIIWHMPELLPEIDWDLIQCEAPGDMPVAEHLLLEAHAEECQIGVKSAGAKTARIIADYYRFHGDFEKALNYFEEYHKLEQDVLREEASRRNDTLLLHFEMEQAIREAEIERVKNIELMRVNEELKSLQKERDEFLNIVVHDLKNPLSNIRMLSTMMLDEHLAPEPGEKSELVQNIVTITERMFNLISNLLKLDAIDQKRQVLQPETFDPEFILANAMRNNLPKAAAKNISLSYEPAGELTDIVSDPVLIMQILDNLLSNAVKFSPCGKSVILRSGATRNGLWFEVRDEGPGFSEEDKAKLFGKFARLSAQPTGGEDSTGLGLSIVKKLVEMLSGTISCESEHGQGACFRVEIPSGL